MTGALRLARAGAVVLAALAVVGCGKRGNPVTPELRVPQAASDLTAVERDAGIELSWSVPRRRVDGTRLFAPGVARLYRTEDAGAGEPRPAMRVDGQRIPGYAELAVIRLSDPPSAFVRDGRVVFADRRDLGFGRRYTYVVVTTDEQGRSSAPSNRVSVTYIAPPEPPSALQAQADDGQVRLAWQPPARLVDGSPAPATLLYEVLRAPDPATAPAVVARTGPGQTTLVDRGLENDRTYHYSVRGVRAEGGGVAAGAAAGPVAATPAKTTPPAPPSDLVAIASRGEVRLAWKPSPSPDVAAHVVYRAAAPGTPVRVGSVRPPGTTFVDRGVPAGTYRYTVTAQDASVRANESAPSNAVTVAVP